METTVNANVLAFIALFSFPLLALGLFVLYPARWAAAFTVIGGHLFLPPNFAIHFSGLPAVDKDLVISISALLGCLAVRPWTVFRGNRQGRRYIFFILILVVGLYFTVQTNPESVKVGRGFLPGLTWHDFLSMTIRDLLAWWPAFLLGRKLFTKLADLEVLCTVWTVGGLVYSLFILVELRMSPQINHWVYGYYASDFDQAIRGGGYRPVVFIGHGLGVAIYILVSVLAATGLARARIRLFGIPSRWIAIYLAAILAAMHSAGALVYGIILVPVLLWMPVRWQARLAMTVAMTIFCYPVLRLYDLLPVDSVLNFFTAVFGAERAGSLGFRLKNEADLLGRAILKPWFGWGGWARQFLYSPWGAQLSIGDGEWIGVLGYSGVVGFVGLFGLLLLPVFLFAKRTLRQTGSRRDLVLASAVLFVCVACLFDLIPNSGVPPHILMTIGALSGIDLNSWRRSESEPSSVGHMVSQA